MKLFLIMENPWLQIIDDFDKGTFILPDDKSVVEDFNKSVSDKYKIHTDIFPAPFMGYVDAPIVLLALNPGFNNNEFEKGYYRRYAHFWKNELQHKSSVDNLRLFCLEKEYCESSDYWLKKLSPLIAISSKEEVANSIFVIQFFPYHSMKYRDFPVRISKQKLKSQLYNFYLVGKAIERGAIIVILRSRKKWINAVPELANYEKCFSTSSYLNPILSENNLKSCFDLLRAALI